MTGITALLSLFCLSQTAQAYPTRVHIAIANDVREDLLASPDGRTLRLRGGDYIVRLSEEDARSVRDWPLAFRAGSIGPDNFVFPAMTDLTHAVGLRPYDQCEDLYQAAQTDQERAYAMGCFLHGSSDAVAHHYVNALTGETFTLNPITVDRADDFDNVVRHIVAETLIQEAWLEAWPEDFSDEAMLHAIPFDFVMRTVTNPDSPVWQRMTTHAVPKWQAIQAGMPEALMVEQALAVDVVPAEHLALIPLYVDRVHIDLDWAIADLADVITDLQDSTSTLGSQLQVGPGPDGTLGTADDTTDCVVTCLGAYSTYFTLIALETPIPDGAGGFGPSAQELIAADIHLQLDGLVPAYVQSVSDTSALLNGGIDPNNPGAELADLDPAAAFIPLLNWSEDLTDLDWDLIVETVAPSWLLDLRDTLDVVGIYLDLGGIVQPLIQPLVDQVREAIVDVIILQVEQQIDALTTLLEEEEDVVRAEFLANLEATAPEGFDGTLLDDLANSGLYIHSFNMVAVTLADHRMVLPTGDEHAGVGAATFDASYTLSWTQPAVCGYQNAILPLGLDRAALLSLRIDGVDFMARSDDSPIECHDGSLGAFAENPSDANCALTDLGTLASSQLGSLSRAYPPEAVGVDISCQNIALDGLPPAEVPNTGTDGPGAKTRGEAEGCGCSTTSSSSGAWIWMALLLLVACKRGGDDEGNRGEDTGPTTIPQTTWPATDGTWSTGTDWDKVNEIGDSTWYGRADFGLGERSYEFTFGADARIVSEIRNPWGPARARTMRVFNPTAAGLETLVNNPGGWENSPIEGESSTWQVSITEGNPRTLSLTRDGVTVILNEGATPEPETGLTAVARSFEPGGLVDDAFCGVFAGGIDYVTLFDFARGGLPQELVAEEVVAGATLGAWQPSGGRFDLADLPEFDRDGGTPVDARENWVVRYTGTVDHAGGSFSMRERNDGIEDGVWVWMDQNVGGQTNNWFLEVHGLLFPDGTPDEPSRNYPAGDLPIEVILVRCDQNIEHVELQISTAGGNWRSAGNASSAPDVSQAWFPDTF